MPTKPFEAYPGNEPYVFVSYAHADRDLVYADLTWLHEAGFRVWYDEGINPTENWVGVIPRRITTCTVFLVFLSPNAVGSRWVRKELNLADRRGLPILPVFLGETELDEELDFQIGSTQSVFRHQLGEAEYRDRLLRHLRRYDGLVAPVLSPDELARALQQGRTLQRQMFGDRADAPPGYTLASWLQPGFAIGSDLHESRVLPDGRWLVLVGDVCGHGVGGALIGTNLMGVFDAVTHRPGWDLAGAVREVNAVFCRRSSDRFVTLTAVLIDPESHRLELLSAGHFAPLLRRATGELWHFPTDRTGIPLGIEPDATYEVYVDRLEPGDAILLVTDGVTDAMTPDGTMFGLSRLAEVVSRWSGSPQRLVEQLRAALLFYTAGARFADDVSVVCVGRVPPPADAAPPG